MSADFPTSLPAFDEPTDPANTPLGSSDGGTRTHPEHHRDLGDELIALATKVGIDGSAVAGTVDYILSNGVVLKSLFDANTILAANTDNTPVAVTVPEATFLGRRVGANIEAMSTGSAYAALGLTDTGADLPTSEIVQSSTFDANTILKADTDDTPVALTVAEQSLVGRVTGGTIDDLTSTQAASLVGLDPVGINAQTGTTYGLVLADAGKLVTLSNTSAVTVTIPTNGTQAFPVGTRIRLLNKNTANMNTAVAGGVTLRPGQCELGQYDQLLLTKIGTDEWYGHYEPSPKRPFLWLLGLAAMPFAVANETWTDLTWTTPAVEQGGEMWDAGNPKLFRAAKAGTWAMVTKVQWAASTVGVRKVRFTNENASVIYDTAETNATGQAAQSVDLASAGPSAPPVDTTVTVGNKIQVYQSSGGNLDVVNAGYGGPQVMYYWTSP